MNTSLPTWPGLHAGNAADQDLQLAPLRLHADHGGGQHPVRCRRGIDLRPDRPFRRSAETARRLEFTRLTQKPFRLALLQMEAVAGDIAANLRTIEAAVREAADAGAVCLGAVCLVAPEMA